MGNIVVRNIFKTHMSHSVETPILGNESAGLLLEVFRVYGLGLGRQKPYLGF